MPRVSHADLVRSTYYTFRYAPCVVKVIWCAPHTVPPIKKIFLPLNISVGDNFIVLGLERRSLLTFEPQSLLFFFFLSKLNLVIKSNYLGLSFLISKY